MDKKKVKITSKSNMFTHGNKKIKFQAKHDDIVCVCGEINNLLYRDIEGSDTTGEMSCPVCGYTKIINISKVE